MGYQTITDEELQAMECLHEDCRNCPHWTGTECDGDLPIESGMAE